MEIAMFGHKRIPSREGGVEIVVEELSVRMVQKGHGVTCCNRGGRPAAGEMRSGDRNGCYRGVRVKTMPTLDKKGLAAVTSSLFAALWTALSPAEVVHIHAEGPAAFCWIPKCFGKRVVVTIHGLDWQREKWKGSPGAGYIHMGEKLAVRFADTIIVLSRNMQDYFRSTYGRETVFIPNGVSKPPIFQPRKIAEKWGLEKDGYFLFLGRLVPEKGVHLLIEAFRNVKTEKRLVIAGGESDSEAYVRGLKKSAEGDARILFTGFVHGQILAELYSNAYVYVLPSALEGMPLSLLEAMSYGNCCVVSDIPECREVVQANGIVCPEGSAAALTECLQKLGRNPALAAEYKKNAREFICEKYSWETAAEQTLEIYRKIL